MLGPQSQVRAARAERRVGFARICRIWRSSRTRCCFVKSMWTEQFNHAPAQLMLQTGHQAQRPPVRRLVGLLRARHGEPGFARLHRADQRRQKSRRGQDGVGQRLSAEHLSRRAVPGSRRADSLRGRIPRASRAINAARRSTRSTRLNAKDRRGIRRSGNAHAHRPVRTRLPHADERAGGDGHCERAGAHSRDVRHRAGQEFLREQLPARAAAVRARRALRAALRLGLGRARRQRRHLAHRRHPPQSRDDRQGARRAARAISSSAGCSTTRSSSAARSLAARR